ncbi:MAG: hypothetical protein IIX06_01615 [Bacteroidales bacterium]|nr:hypothetical protein [Bacteroidales bacterium]
MNTNKTLTIDMETKKQIIFYGELLALVLYIAGHFTEWEKMTMLIASIIMSLCAVLSLTLWNGISWFQRVCNILILLICIVITVTIITLK